MAAQCSSSSSRAFAKREKRRAKRSESLSGSMRQFLTPQVWKQAKQAASQHGCRKEILWTLQPLVVIGAIMSWCPEETDAERFVVSRNLIQATHLGSPQKLIYQKVVVCGL